MKKNILLWLFNICLFLLNKNVVAKSLVINKDFVSTEYNDSLLVIQEIEIKNQFIKKYLEKFIGQKALTNKLFKNEFGYITLTETQYYTYSPADVTNEKYINKWKNDTILSFQIALSSKVLLDESEPDAFLSNYYPAFYTIIEGCPVLIYDEVVNIYFSEYNHFYYQSFFNSDSKKKLQAVINKRLKKVLEPDFRFVSLDGTSYILGLEERRGLSEKELLKKAAFVLTDTYLVYVLRNSTYLEKKL